MEILKTINRILAWPLVVIVVVYQKTLSPDHGPLSILYPYGYCKFYPTCSEFSRQVLLREGLVGIPKIIHRLISCRPGKMPQVDLP
jgi:putative component of membrane protein insertase Oxa1/YidC/SpoIIIJ protein YidD